jgi:hypothetical protein
VAPRKSKAEASEPKSLTDAHVLGEGMVKADPADIAYSHTTVDESDSQDLMFLYTRMRLLGARNFIPCCVRRPDGVLTLSRFKPAH